jgi:hypothetical protein
MPRRRRVPRSALSSEPLDPQTTLRLLEVADEMSWEVRFRTSRAQNGSYRPSWDGQADRAFLGNLCRFLLLSGCDVSVLPNLRPGNLVGIDSTGTFSYSEANAERVATSWAISYTTAKGSETLLPFPACTILPGWIPAFLKTPKPHSKSLYNVLLRRISARMAGLPLNPLRMRYTALLLVQARTRWKATEMTKHAGIGFDTAARLLRSPLLPQLIQQEPRVSSKLMQGWSVLDYASVPVGSLGPAPRSITVADPTG